MIDFVVVDSKTGKEADVAAVTREPWAVNVAYSKGTEFAVTQSDQLMLLDEHGNFAFCPEDRFLIFL